ERCRLRACEVRAFVVPWCGEHAFSGHAGSRGRGSSVAVGRSVGLGSRPSARSLPPASGEPPLERSAQTAWRDAIEAARGGPRSVDVTVSRRRRSHLRGAPVRAGETPAHRRNDAYAGAAALAVSGGSLSTLSGPISSTGSPGS